MQHPAPHAPLLPDPAPPYIAGAGLGWLLVLAWSHAVLSLAYLLVLVTGLLGFGARLATEHV